MRHAWRPHVRDPILFFPVWVSRWWLVLRYIFLISPTPSFQLPIQENPGASSSLDLSRIHTIPAAQCKKRGRQVLPDNSGKHYLSRRGTCRSSTRLLVLVMAGCFLVSIPFSDVHDCLITSTVPQCLDVPLPNSTRSSLSITTSYVHSLHCGPRIAFFILRTITNSPYNGSNLPS